MFTAILMALDEYTVIPVFLAGVLTQAALVARDRKGFAWIGGLLVSGLVAAWFISGPEDRAYTAHSSDRPPRPARLPRHGSQRETPG